MTQRAWSVSGPGYESGSVIHRYGYGFRGTNLWIRIRKCHGSATLVVSYLVMQILICFNMDTDPELPTSKSSEYPFRLFCWRKKIVLVYFFALTKSGIRIHNPVQEYSLECEMRKSIANISFKTYFLKRIFTSMRKCICLASNRVFVCEFVRIFGSEYEANDANKWYLQIYRNMRI